MSRDQHDAGPMSDALGSFVDGFPEPIFLFSALRDGSGRITDFVLERSNAATEALLGVPASEQRGTHLTEASPEVRETGLFERYAEVVETGEPLVLEGLEYDGSWEGGNRIVGTFDVSVAKLADGIAIYYRDQTERRSAERALRASEARFRRLTDLAPIGIFQADAEGGWVFVNERWQALTGVGSDQASGAGWASALHPEDRARVVRAWSEFAAAAHDDFEVEFRFTRADGGTAWALATATSLSDDRGDVVGHLGSWLDVTERRRLQEQARRLEEVELFRALFDSMPQLGWTAHADGFIDFYNRGWYEYTGTTYEEMQGWGWRTVHDPDMLDSVVERWQHSLATGVPFEMEFPLRRHDGVFRWFLTRVQPLRDETGTIVRWVGINTDVDDIRAARELARASAAQSLEAEQQLVDLRAAKEHVERRVHELEARLAGGREHREPAS